MAEELATPDAIKLNNHLCERRQEGTPVQSGNSILPSQPTEREPWQL